MTISQLCGCFDGKFAREFVQKIKLKGKEEIITIYHVLGSNL